jgi:uncharacterized protein YjbI with pentapeptide repeats
LNQTSFQFLFLVTRIQLIVMNEMSFTKLSFTKLSFTKCHLPNVIYQMSFTKCHLPNVSKKCNLTKCRLPKCLFKSILLKCHLTKCCLKNCHLPSVIYRNVIYRNVFLYYYFQQESLVLTVPRFCFADIRSRVKSQMKSFKVDSRWKK